MNIRGVRDIARKFTPEQIEDCITRQIETGKNICKTNASTEAIINELSEAEFIRELTDNGTSLADALRELASRIRRIQEGFE